MLCQRCTRTVCADCQTPAPVGVICPECMKEQRKQRTPGQRRAARQQSSGRVAALTRGPMAATNIIIAITVAVSLLGMIPGAFGSAVVRQLMFFAPYLYPNLFVGAEFEPWRLLTALLVHGGILHLALNMLGLWMLGRILEPMIGHGRFVTLYLVAGMGGSVAAALLAPGSAMVGASGAIFGLLGALFAIGRQLGADVTGIVVVLGINLVIGFLPGMNISWQAHVGGLIVGALVGFILGRTRRPQQRMLQIGAIAAVVVALGVITWVVVPALLIR